MIVSKNYNALTKKNIIKLIQKTKKTIKRKKVKA